MNKPAVLADDSHAPAKGILTGRYIGQRVPRKEDRRLLTGRGQFVDDITLPGMLHVAFARSPIARGKIASINTDVAKDVPGVHAVYTQADLASCKFQMYSFYLAPPDVETLPLAHGRVAYVGEPVVMVVADSRSVAEDAASLVEVTYAEEDPVVTLEDARTGPPVHAGMTDNVASQMGEEEVEAELAKKLKAAPHLLVHKVVHQRISQSPMETRGVVSSPEGSGELTIYVTCQSPHLVARWTSLALGMPQTAIRVIAKDVGGGFGLKNHPWKEECAAILASQMLNRPVKWIEDRYENLVGANQCREQEMTLQVAFDNDGKLLASHGDYHCNNGAFPHITESNIAVHMFIWAAHKMPVYGFLTRGWYSNTVGYGAYRGPWAMESLARETALDVAARRLGIDPIEMRRRNLVTLKDQPYMSCMEVPVEDITPAECLEKLLQKFDIVAFRKEQAKAREQGRLLGVGIATYIEPTGAAGAIATMTGELAQVRIEPTGRVSATMSTHSQGHGTETTMAQIFADRLGVAYEHVTIFEGDSALGGFSPGAAGSRQGVIAGGAAIMAADLLAAKVKKLAGHLLKVIPSAIVIDNGVVSVRGDAEKSISLGDLANIAYGEPDNLPEGFEPGLEAQYRYQPPPITLASAANLCVVEVDRDTGFVKILRWISAEDCGTPLNPAVVEGQVSGGLAQAIGQVLLEEVHFDERGNPTTATYKDYCLPTSADIPDFEFVHASTPSQTVGGMRGVGEGGAIIGEPTLVNAIADALAPFGEVPVSLPLTPAKLLGIIEGRDLTAKSHPQPQVIAAPTPASTAAAATPMTSAPEPSKPLAPQVVVDGDWELTLATPVGPQTFTGHFETTGNQLSGYLESPIGRESITGTVDGGHVVFDLKTTKPVKITLKYNFMIEGDTLAGTCKMGIFGTAKLKGKRIQ